MGTLHVRNVPTRLHDALIRLARRHKRSLTAEVIRLLETAAEDEWRLDGMRSTLSRIRRGRSTLPSKAPDTVSLLREGRAR